MAWAWITKLVPLAGGIIETFKSAKNRKKKVKEIEQSVRNGIVNSYNESVSDMNADVAQLAGWKPIITKIQAIDSILKRWEYLTFLSKLYKNNELVVNEVTKENISILSKTIVKVEQEMDNLEQEAEITWRQNTINLRSSIEKLSLLCADLNESKVIDQEERFINRVEDLSESMQLRTIDFFVYWDEFLESLFDNTKKAHKSFVENLGVKTTVAFINKEYPRTSWSKAISDVFNQIKTVKEEIDSEKDSE